MLNLWSSGPLHMKLEELIRSITTKEVRDGMMSSKLVDNASENNHVNGILTYAMYDSNIIALEEQ